MKIFPFEDSTIYAETNSSLSYYQKARVTSLFKDYIWDTDTIENIKRRTAKENENLDTKRKLVFFNVFQIVNGKDIISLDGLTPIDVDKFDKEEKERNELLSKVGETSFDYRDLLK